MMSFSSDVFCYCRGCRKRATERDGEMDRGPGDGFVVQCTALSVGSVRQLTPSCKFVFAHFSWLDLTGLCVYLETWLSCVMPT